MKLSRMQRKFKHQVIKAELQRELLSGQFKPGERFHTERYIAAKNSVSSLTVRQALAELVDEGWLTRIQGSGTYVCDPASRDRSVDGDIHAIYIDRYQNYPLLLQTITEIVKAANARGFGVKVFTYRQNELYLGNGVLQRAIRDGKPCKVLALSPLSDKEIAYLVDNEARLTLFENPTPSSEIGSVCNDNYMSIALILGHLGKLGHTRIGFVNGTGAQFMHDAFTKALARRGMEHIPGLYIMQSWGVEGGRAGLEAIWNNGDQKPTAIIAADEYLALGVMHHAAEMGISIPTELSVIACADRLSPDTYPIRPTAIYVNYPAMAETAIEMLVDDKLMDAQLIAPSLIERDSTSSPRV